jgi:hypothetical protein
MNTFQHILVGIPYKFSYGSMTHWSKECDFRIQSCSLCKSLFTYPFPDTLNSCEILIFASTADAQFILHNFEEISGSWEEIFKWRPRNGPKIMSKVCHWSYAPHKPLRLGQCACVNIVTAEEISSFLISFLSADGISYFEEREAFTWSVAAAVLWSFEEALTPKCSLCL